MDKISRRKLARYAVDGVEAGRKLNDIVAELAAYLQDSRRQREADLVARAIEDELAARGTVIAHVTSAHALSASMKDAIKQLVDAREIHINETVDPSVIGGVRIETPGRSLDATIKRKLLTLRQAKM